MQVQQLLNATTTIGQGKIFKGVSHRKTYQAVGATTSGTGTATININGSNDGVAFDLIATLTLTLGTVSTSTSTTVDDRYAFVVANMTVLTGTGASVNVTMAF